jgi:C_GCAxxG_C_C family probable redox protein
MTEQEAIEEAQAYFLTENNHYGCAETTMMVLQQAYGLSGAADPSPAMALNGGIASSGGPCGAVTGAAIAIGRLAGQRLQGHEEAKHIARGIVAQLIDEFEARYGAVNCRELTGVDISTDEGHAAFMASKVWRSSCMDQIEFTVRQLISLQDQEVWGERICQLGA